LALSFHDKNTLLDQTIKAALALGRGLGQSLRQSLRLPQQDAERRLQ
jgi:hypothetical protein